MSRSWQRASLGLGRGIPGPRTLLLRHTPEKKKFFSSSGVRHSAHAMTWRRRGVQVSRRCKAEARFLRSKRRVRAGIAVSAAWNCLQRGRNEDPVRSASHRTGRVRRGAHRYCAVRFLRASVSMPGWTVAHSWNIGTESPAAFCFGST